MKTDEDRVEATYARATGSWGEADWDHPYVPHRQHRAAHDEDGEVILCSGMDEHEDCQTCEDARVSAAKAERLAAEAISEYRLGNLDEALRYAERVADEEATWGDNPTWRPFRDAVRDAVREAAEAAEAEGEQCEAECLRCGYVGSRGAVPVDDRDDFEATSGCPRCDSLDIRVIRWSSDPEEEEEVPR